MPQLLSFCHILAVSVCAYVNEMAKPHPSPNWLPPLITSRVVYTFHMSVVLCTQFALQMSHAAVNKCTWWNVSARSKRLPSFRITRKLVCHAKREVSNEFSMQKQTQNICASDFHAIYAYEYILVNLFQISFATLRLCRCENGVM